MFDFFRKKKVCKNIELYQKIQDDGLEYAGSKMAYLLIDKWLKDRNLAYQFVLQELDGASYGNTMAQNFVKNSGITCSEYSGALRSDMPKAVDDASMFLVGISMELQPLQDFIVELRLEAVDGVMKFYKLGKYEQKTSLQNDLEPNSLLGFIEINDFFDFESFCYDVDNLFGRLPQDFNSAMPILYAMRIGYAGLYSQGKMSWEEFNDFDTNEFMRTMIIIGNGISRSEQVYFQEKSMDRALELLKEYNPLFDKQVTSSLLMSAKSKFCLQEIIGDDFEVTSDLSILYFSEFGFIGMENKGTVRKNFKNMLDRYFED